MTDGHVLRIIRFGMIGGSITLLNYLLLIAFTAIGLHYILASTVGWLICVCLNFFLTKRFTFRQRDGAKATELMGFVTTYVLQYLLATGLLMALVDGAGLGLTPAFMLTLLATTAFSYSSFTFVVFRSRLKDRAERVCLPSQ